VKKMAGILGVAFMCPALYDFRTHAPLFCHSLDGAGTLATLRVMGPYAPA